jgi:hypothetical protein
MQTRIPQLLVFLLFMEVTQLLGAETNTYYVQYLDTLDNDCGCSWLPVLFGHKNTNGT